MQTEPTSKAWRKVIAGPLGDEPITRVFVTHLHPDHIGLAGWITRKFRCRMWMTRLEYLQCRMLSADTGREAPQDAIDFYRAAGWDEEALENYRARFGGFGKAIYQLPDSFRRMRDGDEIMIGEHMLAGGGRLRPFARARLPLLPRAEAVHLRRPGAAAHLLQRLGVPHRAGRRSA